MESTLTIDWGGSAVADGKFPCGTGVPPTAELGQQNKASDLVDDAHQMARTRVDGFALSVERSTVLRMRAHAFVDESIRNGYLMSAAVVTTGDLSTIRGKLRELCKPGQRRIHMKDESDSRRREILSTLLGMELGIHLYRSPVAGRPIRNSRDDCRFALVPDLLQLGITRLVIESCSQDQRDIQVIHRALTADGAWDALDYIHLAPAAEPLLWAADVAAWAYGKGADWRRRIAPLIVKVTELP
jgi:hypothetical protein